MQYVSYYLGLSLFPGIGPVTFEKLSKKFGSAKKIWNASQRELSEVVGEKLTEEFVAFRAQIDLEKEQEKVVQKGIQLLTLEDKEYPALLQQLRLPNTPDVQAQNTSGVYTEKMKRFVPFLLYVKGNIDILSSRRIIGIVGTRKSTAYGENVTQMLTRELVFAGFTVVSGLALGVDAAAHSTAIQNTGKTIAVLGCGVDCCTPRENQKLYEDILQHDGAIVSTFPPGMQATKGSFPARNAIIAGISQAIVVTEGAEDSGALITADYAKKFGRPIFAVPGPITSGLSKGPNRLLQQGAIAITSAADILDRLGIMNTQKLHTANILQTRTVDRIQKTESKDEEAILHLLQISPLLFDEIVRKIKKDSKSIGSLLSLMELKGMIKSNGSLYSLER